MKILYTAEATAVGGREGKVQSSDGHLEHALSVPKELGGAGGSGTNPEQLFAAGYSACFESALRHVARAKKISITSASVNAKVGIGSLPSGAFGLDVALLVTVVGPDRDVAQSLVDQAHQVCPYSNATRGNINVAIQLA